MTLASRATRRRRGSRSQRIREGDARPSASIREVCLIGLAPGDGLGIGAVAEAGATFRRDGRSYRVAAMQASPDGRRLLHLQADPPAA